PRVQYALAGHLPIFHITPSGAVTDLANQSLPLGLFPEESYLCGDTIASHGDLFALYTDGLTELPHPAAPGTARQPGHDGLRAVILSHAGGTSLAAAHSAILAQARTADPQADDQTLVLVRVLDRSAAN
ncbi:MAG: SpoIIE family protein phosphatase, partial [Phycisphaerales bacterium]|nr:SpoIIE family protein phosphatase [Phycisphaerales bacterium]